MRNLEPSLVKLYSFIEHADQLNSSISSVNVAWHIEHSLLVITKIIETVVKSDPTKYEWKFDLKRSFVFFIGKFPRGKAKAPEVVIPKQVEQPNYEVLFTHTRVAITQLQNATKKQFFVHPIFGKLNKKDTFIMLDIHTKHHIKIIEDIISQTL
jgi:hypothetical protein